MYPAINILLTPSEVAQEARVTRRTVYNWISSGSLKAQKYGGQWRVRRDDLENR